MRRTRYVWHTLQYRFPPWSLKFWKISSCFVTSPWKRLVCWWQTCSRSCLESCGCCCKLETSAKREGFFFVLFSRACRPFARNVFGRGRFEWSFSVLISRGIFFGTFSYLGGSIFGRGVPGGSFFFFFEGDFRSAFFPEGVRLVFGTFLFFGNFDFLREKFLGGDDSVRFFFRGEDFFCTFTRRFGPFVGDVFGRERFESKKQNSRGQFPFFFWERGRKFILGTIFLGAIGTIGDSYRHYRRWRLSMLSLLSILWAIATW